MTIWKHSTNWDCNVSDLIHREYFFQDEFECFYCSNKMKRHKIDDVWKLEFKDYKRFHYSEVRGEVKEGLIPRATAKLTGQLGDFKCELFVCRVCGWWLAVQDLIMSARANLWHLVLASAGALCKFDTPSVEIPIHELRHYLCAKHDSRFLIHPRRFEETVASVFRDHGYRTTVTAYTSDGGVDIVLMGKNSKKIGIQVKRYRKNIEVEQIRSFLGALTLGGYTKGIFVSTSGFQRGATEIANYCGQKHIPIELINGNRFLDMLGVAQLKKRFDFRECGFDPTNPPKLDCVLEHYMNSL